MQVPAITDGELLVLKTLWEESPLPAAQIAQRLGESVGWSKNTAYTFIARLVDKGVVRRTDPGYLCAPLVTRAQVGVSEGRTFLKKLYGGSLSMMVASFVKEERLTRQELDELRALITGEGEDGHA